MNAAGPDRPPHRLEPAELANLRCFLLVRASWSLAAQMLNVAIAWSVYDRTHSALHLGYVGLAQFLPSLLLGLVAGQAADRLDRRAVLAGSLAVQGLCGVLFLLVLGQAAPSIGLPTYAVLVLFGGARAFAAPALSSLLPRLVGEAVFPRAVALGSSTFQIASIVGPALGGFLYAWSDVGLLIILTSLLLVAAALVGRFTIGPSWKADSPATSTDRGILAGLRFVLASRLILALISLDMVAVLLGGVTALLPIFAQDILAVGPQGLGYLRSAPGLGAAAVGVLLAHSRRQPRAGILMLACVAGFGLATIAFALSTTYWISLVALVALGGFDMVSVVIRQTLIQLATPDAMRGRVSAVNFIFVGASNQLGEFESGVTAALWGTVPAALFGGVGTLVIVGLWTWFFPELRGVTSRVHV